MDAVGVRWAPGAGWGPPAELRRAGLKADEEAPAEEFSGSDSDGDATASGSSTPFRPEVLEVKESRDRCGGHRGLQRVHEMVEDILRDPSLSQFFGLGLQASIFCVCKISSSRYSYNADNDQLLQTRAQQPRDTKGSRSAALLE